MGLFGQKGTLLRSQKKAAFEMLRAAGLDPSDFDWSLEDGGGAPVERLSYRDGQYYFQFSSYREDGRSIASPGAYQLIEYEYPRAWPQQADAFRNWTQHLRRELDCADPWEELAKYRLAIGANGECDGPNETISGAEAEQIGRHVETLADEMKMEFELTPEQEAMVRDRLGHLGDAAMHVKSRDWCYAALGLCTTLAMTLSLDEDQTRQLWSLFKGRIGAYVHLHYGRESGPSEVA